MTSQISKKYLSAILGLAVMGGAAVLDAPAYAEEAAAPSAQLIAQLPSPVRKVANNKAFAEECKIKLSPISGCKPVQYMIVNGGICEIILNYNNSELNYRATKNPNESLVDSKRMTKPKTKPQVFSMVTSTGAAIKGQLTEYSSGAKAVNWEYNKVRYVLMTWSPVSGNDLMLLAHRAAKTDLK
ncbi:MAG: hypothetical protein ACI376_04620 [Candidatus Bruticola sp.]